MNIFFLHYCPMKAAEYQIDRHIVKMPSECCIMLANAYTLEELESAPRTQKGNVRGHGYPHHGCTKWIKYSFTNYQWLLEHARALCEEYKFRTGKIHFCSYFIDWCRFNPPANKPMNGWSTPYLAMPEKYKQNCPVLSYKSYYNNDKQFDSRGKCMWNWTKREKPAWATSLRSVK